MAIVIRGTSVAVGTSGDFTIAPPSGTQVGDLLILIDSESEPTNSEMTGWTRPGSFQQFENTEHVGGFWRVAEDPVPATYTVKNGSGHSGSAMMVALYSDATGGSLSLDTWDIIKVEAEDPAIERPPSPDFDLPSILTDFDNSLLVGLLAQVKSNGVPGTPDGMTSEATHSTSNSAGGHRVVYELIASAGATGTKFIEELANDENSAAIAAAISEHVTHQASASVTMTMAMTAAAVLHSASAVADLSDSGVTASGDYRLEKSSGEADLSLVFDDLANDLGLRTAVLLSLFTDRRATPGDPLPGEDGDLRGWWADEFAEVDGDLFGSLLWLLDRSKITPDLLPRAKLYSEQALAWLVQDSVATRVVATPSIVDGQLHHLIEICRPTGEITTFRFAHVWWDAEVAAL